jgi:hypothetical protein
MKQTVLDQCWTDDLWNLIVEKNPHGYTPAHWEGDPMSKDERRYSGMYRDRIKPEDVSDLAERPGYIEYLNEIVKHVHMFGR